jgi:hypothetical protein
LAKLKLAAIADDRPVKLTIELPAAVHRDLVAYGQVLARETGQDTVEPGKLIAPMLARFVATDRAFARLRRGTAVTGQASQAGLVAQEGHEARRRPDPRAREATPMTFPPRRQDRRCI